ncbi:hypothetical protein Bhyg_08623 [Pseudolycoriella hygida]|uniref:Uncharacterized protein n=1 Tax=Pseudolycoriella hygida TaxID=35572 RepID=A0A9Q0N6R3_9DIPT|nr:hypothetical protein Bhyg_08623 [Pseudolycoriella hygida]
MIANKANGRLFIFFFIGLLSAAALIDENVATDGDLTPSETVFIGPVGAFLTTLGLTYFYQCLGFRPYRRDPRYRYYDRFDDDD